MATIEEQIKGFLRDRGVQVIGIAGHERWKNGPPSIDPNYLMHGAKSLISWAVPFNVQAIYDFLGKKSVSAHNLDQAKVASRNNRWASELAAFLRDQGYRAVPAMTNNTYRRSPDIFANKPSLSHRFAAAISGIGTFGLSGNLVTQEYGAAVSLCTVVTDARLASDRVPPARQTFDNRCRTCKLCDKSCTLGMFRDDAEEYVLLNGELHPRGKRENIDFCGLPCFGLHGISRDRKWSTWGRHWVMKWTEQLPDPQDRDSFRAIWTRMGAKSGDSAPRYEIIRRSQAILWPRDKYEDFIPAYEDLPESEEERYKIAVQWAENMGVFGLKDPWAQTCGNCAIVCGPDFEETKKRFNMLTGSPIVVPGANGEYVRCNSYEEALKIKEKYPHKVDRAQIARDAANSGSLFIRYYFGFEPKSEVQNLLYQMKNRQACARAGLKGREAREQAIYDFKWVVQSMFNQEKKKKQLDPTKYTGEYRA